MSERFIEAHDVTRKTTLSRSTIYRRVKEGTFPPPIPLGSHQKLVWLESEVDEWISARIQEVRGRVAAGSGASPTRHSTTGIHAGSTADGSP